MNFTKENVVEAYRLLNHGQTPQVKKQADDFLNDFLVVSADPGVASGMASVSPAGHRAAAGRRALRRHERAVQESAAGLRRSAGQRPRAAGGLLAASGAAGGGGERRAGGIDGCSGIRSGRDTASHGRRGAPDN